MGSIIQPASFGGVSPGGSNLLLDDYPDAAFAYALRKLRNDYAGDAVIIRDTTTQDEDAFGFVDGDFDIASALSFLNGHQGAITTWYDQSGNNFDVAQSTAVNQPALIASGINSLPSISFGGGHFSRSGVDMSSVISTEGTVFLTLKPNTSGIRVWFSWADSGGEDFQGADLFGDFSFDIGGDPGGRVTGATPGGAGFVNEEIIVELYRDNSDTQAIVVNDSVLGSNNISVDITPGGTGVFYVGIFGGSFGAFLGYMSEFICWPTDLGSTDRANARNNINSYYGVF